MKMSWKQDQEKESDQKKVNKGIAPKQVKGQNREDEWAFPVIATRLRHLRNTAWVDCFLKIRKNRESKAASGKNQNVF